VRPAALLPAVALLFAGTAAAPGPPQLDLTADARQAGWVRLQLVAPAGVPVTIDEQVPGGSERLAGFRPARADTTLPRAAEWRCDRRVRTFVAHSADGRSASAQVRTPSCARRLRASAPRRVRAGARVSVRVADRWGLGDLALRLCVEPPGGPGRCDARRLADGDVALRGRFRASRAGGWRVSARTRYGRALAGVRAAPRGGRLRLLATGDSMIQIIDGFLKQRLGRRGVRVRSDAHISSGISKPSLLNWQQQAQHQAARAPDVVVMFLGANDGFSMGSAACCGEAWVAEYARRARNMMRTCGRGGRTRVYWLTLPTPGRGAFRRTFPAVNAAIRRAAARARRDVAVIDLVDVFTPGGRYRDSMRIGDRVVRVRQSDRVHLNTAGASLAASVIIRTLRRERILR
jgi:lysophospholipase L1-like esterase